MENWAKKAVEKWGIVDQIGMLQEECAELIVAANKVKRGGIPHSQIMMVEEICDVEIMIQQMKETLLIGHKDNFLKIKKEKIQRLINLIKKS